MKPETKNSPREWELLKVYDVQELSMPATIVAIVGNDMEIGERVAVIEKKLAEQEIAELERYVEKCLKELKAKHPDMFKGEE